MNHSHSNPEQRNREREAVNADRSLHQQNEVNSVEELIQLDYSNTELPEGIKHRLLETVPKESQTRQSWWRRFFGKTPTDLE